MDIIKKYKELLIIVLIILALAFYWYEWRPAQIKKNCYTEIMDVRGKKNNYSFSFLVDYFDVYYKNCLRERGL